MSPVPPLPRRESGARRVWPWATLLLSLVMPILYFVGVGLAFENYLDGLPEYMGATVVITALLSPFVGLVLALACLTCGRGWLFLAIAFLAALWNGVLCVWEIILRI